MEGSQCGWGIHSIVVSQPSPPTSIWMTDWKLGDNSWEHLNPNLLSWSVAWRWLFSDWLADDLRGLTCCTSLWQMVLMHPEHRFTSHVGAGSRAKHLFGAAIIKCLIVFLGNWLETVEIFCTCDWNWWRCCCGRLLPHQSNLVYEELGKLIWSDGTAGVAWRFVLDKDCWQIPP